MERHKDEIQALGLKILVIGLGEPAHARSVCGRLAPGLECLTNKTGDLHETFGVERAGLAQSVDPRMMAAVARALSRGNMQAQATGDQAMLGAAFVVDRQGVIRYAHYDRFSGDNLNLRELPRALAADSKLSDELRNR